MLIVLNDYGVDIQQHAVLPSDELWKKHWMWR